MSNSRRAWRAAAATAAVGAVVLSGTAAPAAARADGPYWCYGCVVRAAGPQADTGKVVVLLDDPKGAFDNDWFLAQRDPDRILATAIAAITYNRTVSVNLQGTAQNSIIDRMYLESEPQVGGS
ncbi:hypothetical protein [Actinoplanes philippinensis]|uniref:hypothetical protein n=1 Tax=Actinoplanes philippinensis TaxID=35752 RepID=UPI0033FC5968